MRFLGYDPGGVSRKDGGGNGVCCLDFRNGRISPSKTTVESAIVLGPEKAAKRLEERADDASAIGVDTMLMWRLGGRTCDKLLRRKYHLSGGQVQSLGSLRGAMLGYGVIVVWRLGLPAVEAHPKAALAAGVLNDFSPCFSHLHEDARDAVIAALIAAHWTSGLWRHDLFALDEDGFFPAGQAVYPWPIALAD